jgi:DNA polymerase-1
VTGYREEEGRDVLELLLQHPSVVAVDTETTGLKVASDDHCVGVSLATVVDGQSYTHYFPVAHTVGDNVSQDTVRLLADALGNPGNTLVFAHAQFDLLSLYSVGIDVREQDFIDVQVMAHLVDENNPTKEQGGKELNALAGYYLGDQLKISDPLLEKEKKSGWRKTTPEQIWDYACVDAVLVYRIWLELRNHPEWLAAQALGIAEEKMVLARVLMKMKQRGVRIDRQLAQQMVDQGRLRMQEILWELGYPNLGPKAMEDLFIVRLGLPVVKMTPAKKPSFDKEAMGAYDKLLEEREDDPTVALVREYRGWQKSVTAAYEPYLRFLDKDGRLRCSYKMHGTVTGRLSCVEPNLQQIPKTTDKPWNGRVKECITADEGYVLLNADFKQLELRLGTAYSGEPSLKKVFEEDRDIFTEMSQGLGFDRHTTKTFVYSTQYGAGPDRIMSAFGVDEERANEMLQTYRKTYPKFAQFAADCAEKVRETQTVSMWSGRKRHFRSKKDDYKAMNSVIQGGAADIVERIMIRCFEAIDDEDECRMLLQVHDSITWEVRADRVEHYMALIKTVMEDVNAVTGDVYLDVKFGIDIDFWTDREAQRYAAMTEVASGHGAEAAEVPVWSS